MDIAINDIDIIVTQKNNLLDLQQKGILTNVDAAIKDLTKREFKLKEAKVLEMHPNAITQTTITKNGKKVIRWQTNCGDKRPRCSSYQALIEKLYEIYFGVQTTVNLSFKGIFDLALAEKIATENPKQKTIDDYHNSYKAFITDDFGAKDIRQITPSEVKSYIQTITQKLSPTKKRLYKFKGVLNLVFDYATDPEHKYIDTNPVPKTNRAYTKNCTPECKSPEDKAFQPDELELIRKHLWQRVHSLTYDVNGYAILFSSETGVREGEIPSLKWIDVGDNRIHIHSQQNDETIDGVKRYYYNPTTKNEKGLSQNGRFIPLTDNIRKVLNELKAKQETLGIKSEWVFCKQDGNWITTVAYYEALYKVCKKLGLSLSNNHAFRIALNSYVYVPMGLPVTERAKLLGHSVDTNLKHYTFARTDDYLDDICEQLNNFNKLGRNPINNEGTSGYLKIVDIQTKKKSSESTEFKAL